MSVYRGESAGYIEVGTNIMIYGDSDQEIELKCYYENLNYGVSKERDGFLCTRPVFRMAVLRLCRLAFLWIQEFSRGYKLLDLRSVPVL